MISPKWFHDKKITVFGIGTLGGGVSTVRYLAERGAHVIATDLKSKEDLQDSLDKLKDLKNATFVLGQHRREDFVDVDMVVKTPGCPWTNEHIKLALSQDVPVETDASLFFQLCKAPIVGVTGTKGKTTTARIIYHLLKKGDRTPVLFGVEHLAILDRLSYVKKNSVVVFELSSWRLSSFVRERLSPHIAVFTNIFPDHMDYYKSMEPYFADKKNIYAHQAGKDFYIYNAEDSLLSEASSEAVSRSLTASTHRINAGRGMFAEGGQIFHNDGIDTIPFMDVADIGLRGAHNVINVLLGANAAHAMGVSLTDIKEGIMNLPQVAHRLERVHTTDGVSYYNDTAATNPDAAIAGIKAFDEPIVLIAGGASKKLPVRTMMQEVHDRVKEVIFLKGEGSDKMMRLLTKVRNESAGSGDEHNYLVADSMEEALDLAQQKAVSGDVVLLSPGTSSFGMFKNEFDRGNQFRVGAKAL